MSNLRTLEEKAAVYDAPDFVTEDLIYLTIGGSRAYGVASPKSDIDMYGICIPPIGDVLPLFSGHIPGFGVPKKPWPHWGYKSDGLDMMVYSIVRFFNMATVGNPNIIELLYTEDHHIMFMTDLGVSLRGSRDMFLSHNIIPKFTGYYYSQKNAMTKYTSPDDFGKGYNAKAAYHSMRLLLELEQLLETGTMSLEKYTDLLTGVRFGGFTPIEIESMLEKRMENIKYLEAHSVLRDSPNEEYIKQVLVEMLETHWDFTLDML